jgi:AmiR/NasT family two-component response regulator
MDDGDVNIRNRFVVSEAPAIPIATVIAPARIAEAVIDAAVEAYMVTPIAAVPTIPSLIEIPIGRCP